MTDMELGNEVVVKQKNSIKHSCMVYQFFLFSELTRSSIILSTVGFLTPIIFALPGWSADSDPQ